MHLVDIYDPSATSMSVRTYVVRDAGQLARSNLRKPHVTRAPSRANTSERFHGVLRNGSTLDRHGQSNCIFEEAIAEAKSPGKTWPRDSRHAGDGGVKYSFERIAAILLKNPRITTWTLSNNFFLADRKMWSRIDFDLNFA